MNLLYVIRNEWEIHTTDSSTRQEQMLQSPVLEPSYTKQEAKLPSLLA